MTEDTSLELAEIPKQMDVPNNLKPLMRLKKFAKKRKSPITIFDLETTTNIPYVKWMGITEVGFLTIYPDGSIKQTSALVNPERNIPPKVRELTGIMNEDVRGQPTWDAWKHRFHKIASEHLVIGYNCASFDCVIVEKQNERYGLSGTLFANILDARFLPDVRGKLEKAAGSFGITSNSYHRAMADVWATVFVVEAVAVKYGLEILESHIRKPSHSKKRPSSGSASFSRNKKGIIYAHDLETLEAAIKASKKNGTKVIYDPSSGSFSPSKKRLSSNSGSFTPNKKRKEELTKYFEKHGSLPDLEAFGKERNIKKNTVEADVLHLIQKEIMPNSVLENPVVQKWLSVQIEAAIESCWVGEDKNRLKPLFLYFTKNAPEGFDYTQLKLALGKRGK
jgi:DNA polymerase III epsilon subunit-like protein